MTAFASARKIKIRCVRLSSCDCAGTSAHAPPTIAMPHGGASLSASSRAICGPIRGVVAASGRPNVWCSVPSPRRPGPRVVLARPRADIGGRSLDLISKDAVLRLGGRSFRLVTPARSRPGERFRTVGRLIRGRSQVDGRSQRPRGLARARQAHVQCLFRHREEAQHQHSAAPALR